MSVFFVLSFGNQAPALSNGINSTINWIPTPEGSYELTLRAYVPNTSVASSYIPPSIVDVEVN